MSHGWYVQYPGQSNNNGSHQDTKQVPNVRITPSTGFDNPRENWTIYFIASGFLKVKINYLVIIYYQKGHPGNLRLKYFPMYVLLSQVINWNNFDQGWQWAYRHKGSLWKWLLTHLSLRVRKGLSIVFLAFSCKTNVLNQFSRQTWITQLAVKKCKLLSQVESP